jgi:hypothetical protein
MSYYTLEFRLFSIDILSLYNLYFNVPPKGTGLLENPRIDTYLNCRNKQNGIKFRDGGLEIKVQSGLKTIHKGLFAQNWIKWRYISEEPKENKASSLLQQSGWLSVLKNRKVKSYLDANEHLQYGYNESISDNGVSVDFSEVQIPEFGIHVGTLGIEAFSSVGNHGKIMEKAIELIGKENLENSEFEILSYPEFIYRYCIPFQNEQGKNES